MEIQNNWIKKTFPCLSGLCFIATFLGMLILAGPVARAENVPRTVFVHLFEWRWDDIAKECETFLGPKGFAAVQVSPPNEHRLAQGYPWWERYQPVSYKLESRSGNEQQFKDMVSRCKAAGVNIYADSVINHMTGPGTANDSLFGKGTGGSTYAYYAYPPYPNKSFFHVCQDKITDWGNRWKVQNCDLEQLADLDTGSAQVQSTIAAYLNNLIKMGVAGFRIDAAKHMDTNEIHAILAKVQGNPEIIQEVIEGYGEPIQAPEYFQNGKVNEFDYGKKIAEFFRGGPLAALQNFGGTWKELMPSDKAVVFVDNHDKQRGHGGGGDYITFKDGRLYDLANVFMLAWPYGYPQLMSSYAFDNTDAGPPSDREGHTKQIYQGNQPNCFNEWKCEHRWRPIANMVAFRNNTLSDWHVDNWWSNGKNQIAFSRGDKGFLVINKEDTTLDRNFQTGMAGGRYCNVIEGDFVNGNCTGPVITVNGDGAAKFTLSAKTAAAIHIGAKISPVVVGKRTVILISAQTNPGQDLFIRGGIDHGYVASHLGKTCTNSNFECAIPITHRNLRNSTTAPWKQGEQFLDWYGQESLQTGQSHGITAQGTPLDWTTNKWSSNLGQKKTVATDGYGEEPLNTFGPHYWMLDVDMDCSRTVDGWFEFKSYITNGPGWEGDVHQFGVPYQSNNHFARCGYLNIFNQGVNQPVAINPLP